VAVRVRKLARELDRSSEDVLLLLRDLGIDRFRTEDDMLPDPVVEQVRKAARTRPPRALIASTPPELRETLVPADRRDTRPPRTAGTAGASTRAPSSAPSADGDLMAMLVPGVVRVGERRKASAAPLSTAPKPATRRPPTAAPTEDLRALAETAPMPDRRAEVLEALQREVERLREDRADDARALQAATEAVQEQERSLAALRVELEAARARVAELEARPPEVAGTTLLGLLEERGLRGFDEAERALAALSGAHVLGRLMGTLMVADPGAMRRTLAERLVLYGGPVPADAAYPAVTVSPERADLPSADALQRVLGRIGELSLLNGWRRVLVVGVAPKWHPLVREGIDRRVELVFRASVGEEPGRIDLVVVWTTQESAPADPRHRRLDLRAGTFGEFLERWAAALAG
jgi:hypothetical protein